jgi:hypothetical protein
VDLLEKYILKIAFFEWGLHRGSKDFFWKISLKMDAVAISSFKLH